MQAVNWAIKVMDGPGGECRWGGWTRLDWGLLQSPDAGSTVDRDLSHGALASPRQTEARRPRQTRLLPQRWLGLSEWGNLQVCLSVYQALSPLKFTYGFGTPTC